MNIEYVSAIGECGGVVGQGASGEFVITKRGNSYTLTDGQITKPLSVQGNFGTFSYHLLGVTSSWTLVVYDNDARMYGMGDISAGSICDAEAVLNGSRTAGARLAPSVESDDETIPVFEVLADADIGEESGDGTRLIVLQQMPPATGPRQTKATLSTFLELLK